MHITIEVPDQYADAVRWELEWRGHAFFHHALCVGPCCVVADEFMELSCAEYASR